MTGRGASCVDCNMLVDVVVVVERVRPHFGPHQTEWMAKREEGFRKQSVSTATCVSRSYVSNIYR